MNDGLENNLRILLGKFSSPQHLNNGEWKVKCPLHGDEHGSLYIKLERDHILMHCFGNCDYRDILKAVNLPVSILYPPRNKQRQGGVTMREEDIEAIYDYGDYEKIRLKGKKFIYRRNTAGGYVYSINGIEKTLFKLGRVKKAIQAGKPVFLVEGEKDVQTLEKLGYAATTAGGASDWRPEFANYFTGAKEVVILPDNDEAGMALAEKEAKDIYPVAPVKIVTAINIGMPKKADISDFFLLGNTTQKLEELIDATPYWKPTELDKNDKENDEEEEKAEAEYELAQMLIELWEGKYHWVYEDKNDGWMRWSGVRWERTPQSLVIYEATKELVDKIDEEKAFVLDREEQERYAKLRKMACLQSHAGNAIKYLQGAPEILCSKKEFDANEYLLNFKNGTLDLLTFEFRPHNPKDKITHLLNIEYRPELGYGRKWLEHIELVQPNENIRREIQRELGVALCGANLIEMLPIWWGSGGNGKSTTILVMQELLGELCGKAASNLIVSTRYERHPTEIADLYGKRVVFSVEMDKLKRLDEAKVKELTGGDIMKGRFMYGNFFEFKATHTLFLVVNHMPNVSGRDKALWRRIRLVPWTTCISDRAERKPQAVIVRELLQEKSQIINWMVDGLKDFMNAPDWMAEEVRMVTQEYYNETDDLAEFFENECTIGKEFCVSAKDLYEAYIYYCDAEKIKKTYSKTTFGKKMRERGFNVFKDKTVNSARWYAGITLKGKPQYLIDWAPSTQTTSLIDQIKEIFDVKEIVEYEQEPKDSEDTEDTEDT